jgi:hypothetical protein
MGLHADVSFFQVLLLVAHELARRFLRGLGF